SERSPPPRATACRARGETRNRREAAPPPAQERGSAREEREVQKQCSTPCCRLLSKALKKSGNVNLIGFVVSRQRINHEVDAETIRHLALALAARRHRIERTAICIARPCGGVIIRADHN